MPSWFSGRQTSPPEDDKNEKIKQLRADMEKIKAVLKVVESSDETTTVEKKIELIDSLTLTITTLMEKINADKQANSAKSRVFGGIFGGKQVRDVERNNTAVELQHILGILNKKKIELQASVSQRILPNRVATPSTGYPNTNSSTITPVSPSTSTGSTITPNTGDRPEVDKLYGGGIRIQYNNKEIILHVGEDIYIPTLGNKTWKITAFEKMYDPLFIDTMYVCDPATATSTNKDKRLKIALDNTSGALKDAFATWEMINTHPKEIKVGRYNLTVGDTLIGKDSFNNNIEITIVTINGLIEIDPETGARIYNITVKTGTEPNEIIIKDGKLTREQYTTTLKQGSGIIYIYPNGSQLTNINVYKKNNTPSISTTSIHSIGPEPVLQIIGGSRKKRSTRRRHPKRKCKSQRNQRKTRK